MLKQAFSQGINTRLPFVKKEIPKKFAKIEKKSAKRKAESSENSAAEDESEEEERLVKERFSYSFGACLYLTFLIRIYEYTVNQCKIQ